MALLLLFQNVIPAEVSLVCVVKPDEFWDKKVTHFCFWKEKDRLGFEVSLLAAGQTSLLFTSSSLSSLKLHLIACLDLRFTSQVQRGFFSSLRPLFQENSVH